MAYGKWSCFYKAPFLPIGTQSTLQSQTNLIHTSTSHTSATAQGHFVFGTFRDRTANPLFCEQPAVPEPQPSNVIMLLIYFLLLLLSCRSLDSGSKNKAENKSNKSELLNSSTRLCFFFRYNICCESSHTFEYQACPLMHYY